VSPWWRGDFLPSICVGMSIVFLAVLYFRCIYRKPVPRYCLPISGMEPVRYSNIYMYIYIRTFHPIHLSILMWKKKIYREMYTSVTSCSLYPLLFSQISRTFAFSPSLSTNEYKRKGPRFQEANLTIHLMCVCFWYLFLADDGDEMMIMMVTEQVRGPFSFCCCCHCFMDR